MSSKKYVLIIFPLAILFLFCCPSANAQTSTPSIVKSGYGQGCLSAKFYDIDRSEGGLCGSTENCPRKNNDIDWEACEAAGILFKCTYSHFPRQGAQFELEGAGFPPNVTIYPYFWVVPESSGKAGNFTPYATTGNSATDLLILGADNTGGRCRLGIQYDSANGAYISDAQGQAKVTGRITSACQYVEYYFYGYYEIPPVEVEENGIGGEHNTQQLGNIPFSSLITESSEKNCTKIYWDPYGRVFDSISLEPIKDIKITLLSSLNPRIEVIMTMGQPNPYTTYTNGVFNFVVPEGIYYLNVSNTPPTHTFTDNPGLNPLYKKIYYQDKNKLSSLYSPSNEIKELIDTIQEQRQGHPDMEERDIPLDPGKNPPHISQIQLYTNTAFQLSTLDSSVFRGQSSHPFPIVDLLRSDTNELIYSQEMTDEYTRYGFWQIVLSNNKIPLETPIQVVLRKNPKYFQTYNDLARSKENLLFEPILKQINGYIKDIDGHILANTKIDVVIQMNNAVYKSYKTDATGYLFISSKDLPLFAYYLSANNHAIKTSQFGKANQKYLSKNQINLMAYTGIKKQIINNSSSKISNSAMNDNQDIYARKALNNHSNSQSIKDLSNPFFTYILLIIFGIIAVGFITAYIIKKGR